jgi:CheY-like chemotaxis protein
MASGVAHDLNQSLALVAGHADLAAQAVQTSDNGAAREHLETIAAAAQSGGDSVKRLLVFARNTAPGEPERLDAGVLLRELAGLTAPCWRDQAQAQGRPIHMQLEVADGELAVRGWPADLREALTNLVFNAVDALPQGGNIRLAVQRRGDVVEISVADNGVGMPPEVQARIFEPFFTTKGERGTGLGLAMVFGIVEQHHGQLSVDSRPNGGTTITIGLPTAPDEAPLQASDPELQTARRGLRLLVVDDEPALARMVARLLGSEGYSIATVHSGQAAVDWLERGVCDVIVSDLGLGEGMTGWDLAATVRRRWPSTRFILSTGWGADIDSAHARARGVDAVIAKPYRGAELRHLVAHVGGSYTPPPGSTENGATARADSLMDSGVGTLRLLGADSIVDASYPAIPGEIDAYRSVCDSTPKIRARPPTNY